MTCINAHKALLADVEAGKFIESDMLPAFGQPASEPEECYLRECLCGAYNGDLNAARSLHEAVLPGCRARIDVGRRFRAWVITEQNVKFNAYSTDPARAWLIAILKALISEANTQETAQ